MSPRASSVAFIEFAAGVPSGNNAGTSTALWRAKTPGPGSPAAFAKDEPRKRSVES